MAEIVLLAPEIPQNTGSIARLCAATGCGLHLVGPLGFSIDDKHLKRAGLDYWQEVCLGIHKNLEAALKALAGRPLYYASKKARRLYTDIPCRDNDVYVFGPESVGLPESCLHNHPEQSIRIPIRSKVRSLNLSAAVHIIVFHNLAQLNFPGLEAP